MWQSGPPDVPSGGLEYVACESHIISNQELLLQLPPQEIHAHVCKHVSGLTHTPMWKSEVTLQWWIFKAGSLSGTWGLPIRLDWLASKPRNPPVSVCSPIILPCLRSVFCFVFLHRCWRSTQGPFLGLKAHYTHLYSQHTSYDMVTQALYTVCVCDTRDNDDSADTPPSRLFMIRTAVFWLYKASCLSITVMVQL